MSLRQNEKERECYNQHKERLYVKEESL
jgi:hypothetical protein